MSAKRKICLSLAFQYKQLLIENNFNYSSSFSYDGGWRDSRFSVFLCCSSIIKFLFSFLAGKTKRKTEKLFSNNEKLFFNFENSLFSSWKTFSFWDTDLILFYHFSIAFVLQGKYVNKKKYLLSWTMVISANIPRSSVTIYTSFYRFPL